ncbi:zinc finger and BTB domain-containing protein 11-like [Gossypium australe]|uniref:Zinc finger and BTB domain-containing protein 11-like n=1 Tax=Gossypium australe TaxID=47621 RepID=A0A5B6VA58_9ROSI|nr:zinc finger and BTB domain-containing protein 11-like [Gossypium australe]
MKSWQRGFTNEGVLYFCGRLCVPRDEEIQQMIFSEAYNSLYAMHPGSNKMYRDLCELYWWPGLKAPISFRTTTPTQNSRMEVGKDHHGLCVKFSTNYDQARRYLGDCRSPHQECALLSCSHQLYFAKAHRDLHCSNSETAWHTSFHYFQLRSSIYFEILEEYARSFGLEASFSTALE